MTSALKATLLCARRLAAPARARRRRVVGPAGERPDEVRDGRVLRRRVGRVGRALRAVVAVAVPMAVPMAVAVAGAAVMVRVVAVAVAVAVVAAPMAVPVACRGEGQHAFETFNVGRKSALLPQELAQV